MFSNWLAPSITTNAPSPDVILELGPPPFARYAAHGALLVAHSGYLRSAIRPDENGPIYLPNITAEQFAPLLTYMYTGYLDLNMDNIFGVLLATHILHMPRALEICRAFLTRTQPDGYFGHSLFAGTAFDTSPIDSGVKVVRPIASKATGRSLGFIAAPQISKLCPSQDTPFKSLNSPGVDHRPRKIAQPSPSPPHPSKSPQASTSKSPPTIVKSSQLLIAGKPLPSPHRSLKRVHTDKVKVKSSRSSTDVTEKIVVTDSTTSTNDDSNKVIIDVASCDGPIRFQRVLNDAYGRIGRNVTTTRIAERSNENVANSFHVQMARTISERQAVSTATDSENSQDIVIVHDQHDATSDATTSKASSSAKNTVLIAAGKSDEVYSCVYCKHTFKSQYCYQKHAKRHINPLSIDGEVVVEATDTKFTHKDEKSGKVMKASRREVRPLDMNVQYYPCKTCGSKFPSYYFVHKHRKMCHANEEN